MGFESRPSESRATTFQHHSTMEDPHVLLQNMPEDPYIRLSRLNHWQPFFFFNIFLMGALNIPDCPILSTPYLPIVGVRMPFKVVGICDALVSALNTALL